MSRSIQLELRIREYNGPEELKESDRDLLKMAKDTSQNSHSPYSGLAVGAALMLDSGEIITANNRENAAFPSGICAEHAAIAYAGSNYPGSAIKDIAICARRDKDFTKEPVTPCGKCRQVMAEEELKSGKKIRVIMFGKSRIYIAEDIESLLPLQFKSLLPGF
ncbi:MAG TPA: cytidine deaminase [Bacteroidales bacterium]|nr:cytidine deaminase [Bacteroidales bacterium]